jgi:hypothetical protein
MCKINMTYQYKNIDMLIFSHGEFNLFNLKISCNDPTQTYQ